MKRPLPVPYVNLQCAVASDAAVFELHRVFERLTREHGVGHLCDRTQGYHDNLRLGLAALTSDELLCLGGVAVEYYGHVRDRVAPPSFGDRRLHPK